MKFHNGISSDAATAPEGAAAAFAAAAGKDREKEVFAWKRK